jgi:hypothetical protein
MCCFYITKWRTSDWERPVGWWPHLPEILLRIPTVTTARTLRLCCVFRYSMEHSENCDVLAVQVMYKLRNTLFSVMFRMLATGYSHNLYWYYVVRPWTSFMSFKQPHDISVDTAFQIIKYENSLYIVFHSHPHLNVPTSNSQFPYFLPLPSHTLSNHPNTICCQHTILIT